MYLDKEENLIKFVKEADYGKLNVLSKELREFIIEKVANNGGHLSSNLGMVELTIAIHRVFDSPSDKIVFDVGHQSYVHKILTGRKNEFDSLRRLDGMSGFPKRAESVHDMFDSGHSSTSVSVAFGYAKARDLKSESYNCVAVIGDGALTGGVAYEALNELGDSMTPMIVILNDNQMSIGKSSGAMTKHLNNLRTSRRYLNFKNIIKKYTKNLPGIYKRLQGIRDVIKDALLPSGIFEELGLKYFGPINGHDIKKLTETLEMAKSLKRPVLVHVVTTKGKGFAPAEENPSKFHGIGKFDPKTVSSNSTEDSTSFSNIFGTELLKLAENDSKICAITAAMLDATGLKSFAKAYPKRVFDVGIAEQHAVSFAAGLALNGMKPVVCIYSTFLQRAYDQIVTEVALQNLPVVFAIDRAGITGKDGETHQGMFDIAFLNSIPNMTILAPKDGSELKQMLKYALSLNSPVAIRYPRSNEFDLSNFSSDNNVNTPEILCGEGENLLIAVGSMTKEALLAKDRIIAKNAKIINLRQLKPLNEDFLKKLNAKKIIIAEDGCLSGSAAESIMKVFSESDVKIKAICWPDKFIEHGSIEELRNRYGLNSEAIAKACEEFF